MWMTTSLAISDERLQRLYAYWLGKRGDRFAPTRADILPDEIKDLLPWVFLMEQVGERLRYRLAGDAFREMYGEKLIGKFMDEIDTDHVTAAYIGEYARAAAEGPVVRQWKFIKNSGRHLEYERIIMPLASDGKTVDMFLGGAVGVGFG
jgi:hypothetical protein